MSFTIIIAQVSLLILYYSILKLKSCVRCHAEAGKGGITVKDLRRVAIDHDFIWSDKEINDMVHLFDSDGDGKLHLDDFQKILHRCNMIKG
ncbi:calmodulin-like protein [Thalictrum thalictroides]|uniref:Calmodulin-like protein n=1 Tax=Thalictrum thalictroides TaxID=46969 RepID=A0A7J6VQF2_THATH|nr:calmodulin-like protein [Thalictrum thalictroides]